MSDYTDFSQLWLTPMRRFSDRKKRHVWGYQLTQDLLWEVGYKGSGLFVKVPAGFFTDLASIPAIFTPVMNGYSGEFAKAGAVHDWLRPSPFDAIEFPRPVWDLQAAAGEFYHALKADEVPRWRRKTAYFAVVHFGTRKEEW